MRFEFLREDGTVCAAGHMKGAAVSRPDLVLNRDSYDRTGVVFEPTEILQREGLAVGRARAPGGAHRSSSSHHAKIIFPKKLL
jgi:hypothetical protein